jgi:glucan biosynthesis protein
MSLTRRGIWLSKKVSIPQSLAVSINHNEEPAGLGLLLHVQPIA